jgi:type VI secretion system protein ImpE
LIYCAWLDHSGQAQFYTMTSVELLHAGRLDEALVSLQSEIRNKPEDSRLRIFLFQLNCLLGRFEKALTQLQVLASIDAETMLLAQVFRPLIECEFLRREVFTGKRTPLVFGEPMEWLGQLVQANSLVADGKYEAAAELRSRAFEAAPATPGSVNGQSVEWLADGDSRLGPVLEAVIEGRYFWVPLCRVRKLAMEKPSDLRDLVWLPVVLTWTNGGTSNAHIPVRYSGSEDSSDPLLRLARKTEWGERPGETFLGLGQRLLTSDAGEHPLLECTSIELAQG